MIIILLIAASFLISYYGIKKFCDLSHKRNLLDIPNERSSHTVPTPRGGGIVIALYFIILTTVYYIIYPDNTSLGFLAGVIVITSVSWLDDLYNLPSALRLIFHVIAAILVTLDVGGMTQFTIPSIYDFTLNELPAMVLTVFWIVLMVNAYNFMDGIDGLAGMQALLAGIAWLAVGYYFDIYTIKLLAAVIASCSLGFLLHNWQPAKVFMGDVGSAFFGFIFATLPLISIKEKPEISVLMPFTAILFMWPFIIDVLITLLKRLINVKRLWEAHREHFYQQMVLKGKSHSAVSKIYALLTICCILAVFVYYYFQGNTGLLAILSCCGVAIFLFLFTRYSKGMPKLIKNN